ncbi:MAG: hypothetical protein Q7S35_12130 [Candidatus Limnocylindrales bacterium]|nr:hypothetical protein [Candidatus Limnocylindrales bacterium]
MTTIQPSPDTTGGPYLDDDTITGVKEEQVAPVVDGRISFDVALAREPAVEPSAP